jgi:hypothetical protein
MRVYRWLSLSLFFLLFTSCGKPLPEWSGIEMEKWRADKNGCEGYRAANLGVLEKQLTTLEALNEMDIIEFLGKPDLNELSKRNQKIYYYHLQAGPTCSSPLASARTLTIRFNAVGLAKEIAIE